MHTLTLSDTGSYCFLRFYLPVLWLVACSDSESSPDRSGTFPPASRVAEVQVSDPDSAVAWFAWSAAAFEEAERMGKPVLLYTTRVGCDGLFGGDDPLARWQAETRYIPVRVDPDRDPAVTRRYAPAGCPSLSILLHGGAELVRATDIRRENVPLLLSRMNEHLQKRRAVVEEKIRDVTRRAPKHELSIAAVRQAADAAYDSRYGGFGGPVKFPETQVLAFLQELAIQAQDDGAGLMVQRTLDGLLASSVWAQHVQSLSYTPDWQTPRDEAFAADQAGMLFVLGRSAGASANSQRAGQQLFDTIHSRWYDEASGAFFSRSLAGAGPGQSQGRAERLIQADANALLIRALLQTGEVLERDATARRLALSAGEVLMAEMVGGEGSVRHTLGRDAPWGLLRDQMLVALALNDLAQATGRADFAATARKVRVWADEYLWDHDSAQFMDGPARSWPASWEPLPHHADDRAPSGTAVAAEAIAAAGDTSRALRILHAVRLVTPAARQHAAATRQLLLLESSN